MQTLNDYLRQLTGEEPSLETFQAEKLPLYLRNRFQLKILRLFGQEFFLAMDGAGPGDKAVGDYEEVASNLSRMLGRQVVLVLPGVPAYVRARMLRKGIPFIVPGSQMFLPTALIDLRERQRPVPPGTSKAFSPVAQYLLLHHLQREPLHFLEAMPLKETAQRFKISAVMLSYAKAELESSGLCASFRTGRTVALQFLHDRPKIWELALPRLRTPVLRRHWVKLEKPGLHAPRAGMSALSVYTHISDDAKDTYAVYRKEFFLLRKSGDIRVLPDSTEADWRVEEWSYPPCLPEEADDRVVERLSLYLSLQGNPDERVQQQRDRLIGMMGW
jgi:hypothetical protein